ncbi:MAG TPA: ADP-heptose--LPS heptosyltransferase, partial [Rhodospirillaceae bacterium]|nr:ADP-heptose--LPS heptosyltransferase [Rhodospirillaceae bacterium]
MTASRILVIKLGALGDFIQAMGPFRVIREFHREARITLLTTAPFAALARECGYF